MCDLAYRNPQRVPGLRLAGKCAAHKIAHAPQNERDEPLRGAANAFIGFIVHIKLSCDEQEIIADAVKENGGKDQRCLRGARANAAAQKKVPRRPGQNADKYRFLITKLPQHQRQQD